MKVSKMKYQNYNGLGWFEVQEEADVGGKLFFSEETYEDSG